MDSMRARTSAKRERIGWLDALRGVAMITVVIAHAASVPSDIEVLIYSFHMPLFYMISGFTFRPERYQSLRACVADEARRLLVPYIVLYWLSIPLWYLNWVVLDDKPFDFASMLIQMFLVQNLHAMPNGALWFLPSLFLTSVVYWLLCDLDRNGRANLTGTVLL